MNIAKRVRSIDDHKSKILNYSFPLAMYQNNTIQFLAFFHAALSKQIKDLTQLPLLHI